MAGEDFFKFNKGNEFRFSNFREIKEEDLKGADEKTKKLFNIFAGEDKILQEVEAKSLFNVLKSAAGDNQVLEDNEIKAFAKEHIGEEVDTNILATFVNNIFGTKEKPQTQAVQNVLANAPQKQQTFLEEAACKEIVIDIIDENLSEAYEILNSQYLGSISGWHDERKDKNDILKTSNVSKVLDYQNAGIEWMNKAKLAPPNGLTKKEYYEGNKQRIKDMILTRILVLDTNTKFKELKNKYSEEKLAQIIGDYVEQLCSNASIEDLKDIQKQFVSYSGVEEIQALENVVDNAIKFNADKNKPVPYSERPLPKFDNSKGIVPEYWNTDEPISFEEVYKIERGTEYSQYKIEQYALAKKEMEVVANAYNKKQQFIEFAEGLRKDETLNIDEKTQKVLEGFATFYALAEDGGLSQLQELIAESKLPISIDENGFNFGTLDDSAKNRALNSLLKLAQQSKEKEFEEFLNGKTIEDYQIALAQAHDEAIGDENGKMMAEAMKNDNLTCIQRWTGNTSMAGMGMTIVGGILCFTPLAPLGAGMITVGNTLAIGGMVAKTGLGVTDYATKDVQTAEEAEQLTKDFIMDAGGFIIGMGAGKAGLKAFSKLIDKKLVAVFGQQIASGNKMQALKTVFTNPEYLKNFMTAAGAKLSADFVISYAGDLAMMGILDTQDDWQSLLKANLTGILVGMSGDIKDVSGVGRPRNFGVSDGVRPMTEMDYGQRLLGNDVTVADPKTGATVEGTVTGLYSQNGQVEIEVNGQRYSTNDVAEVKREVKVEVETPKVEISLGQRLETASSREEFVAIRDEIKAMPAGTEKTALQQEYLRKYNEFSRKYNEEFDIRMEYKPETAIDITKLKIEDASIEDLKAIHKIDIEAFKDSYLIDSNFDDYKIDLEEQGISTYAIKADNGDVIGYYQLEPVESGELYIYSIGVRSDLRNTKASYAAIKQMQESITKFAQENNIEKVVLDVDASKPELVKLYKKFGFEITAEDKGVEAGHEYHDYRMEINVKSAIKNPNGTDLPIIEGLVPKQTSDNEALAIAKRLNIQDSDINYLKENYSDFNNIINALEILIKNKDVEFDPIEIREIFENIGEARSTMAYITEDNIKFLQQQNFNFSDAINLISNKVILYNLKLQNPEIVKKLLNETVTNSKGQTRQRFTLHEISKIISAYNVEPEITAKLLEITELNNKGETVYRFGGYNIVEIVEAYKQDPELMGTLLEEKIVNSEGLSISRFSSHNIVATFESLKEFPELALKLIKETKVNSDGEIIPRFDDVSLIIPVYNENPELVIRLTEETEVTYEGKTVFRFNDFDIKAIIESYKEKPQLTMKLLDETTLNYKGETEFRFHGHHIAEIIKASKEFPDFVSLLLEESSFSPYEDSVLIPRFKGHEIGTLINAYRINPELTLKLINEKRVRYNGDLTPRFESFQIATIIELHKENPELVIKLLEETVVDYTNKIRHRFDSNDIRTIVDLHKENPQLTMKLLEENDANIDGQNKPRFTANHVSDIIKANKECPDLIKYLLEQTITNDKGQQFFRFSGDNISRIINSYKENPQLTMKLLKEMSINNKGESTPRFNASSIESIVKSHKENAELVARLIEETIYDNNQVVPRFSDVEISELLNRHGAKGELITKLLDVAIEDSNGNKKPRFNYNDINTLINTKNLELEIVIKLSMLTTPDGDFIKRNMQEVVELSSLYKTETDKELVLKFASMTLLGDEGLPRFNYEEISDLVELYKVEKETVDALLEFTYIDSKGFNRPRFTEKELCYLISTYKEKPELIKKFGLMTTKHTNGNTTPRFSSFEIKSLIEFVEESSEIEKKYFDELIYMTTINKGGYTVPRFDEYDIISLVSYLSEKPELVKRLLEVEGTNDNGDLTPRFSREEIATLCRLEEEDLKTFFNRSIEDIPLSFQSNICLLRLSENDYEKIKNIITYFDKNIEAFQHHDMDVSRKMLSELVINNRSSVFDIINLIGETGLRHATELKYKGLSQLFANIKALNGLDEKTLYILKSKLEQLPHPEQKLSKLEVITAISGKIDNDAILEIIDKISNPKMTIEQKELADRIFSTNKPYQEQINDFIREFNVPKERENQIRKFLLEQKLNEKFVTPPSIEEQIAIIDKKIDSINRNDKIPADKKQAYLNQLERQKSEIIANPEQYTQARINDRAIKPLEAQVEAHINLPNQNKEFTKAINEQIYKILNIDVTEELLLNINYDSKFISKLFAGVSNVEFRNNFSQLIDLIKANPNKKLTEIIKELPENIETRKMFEENGLDFERWATFDATSNYPFTVKVNVEEAVRKASINLKDELISELATRLDKKEIDKLIQILEDNNIDIATQKDLPKIIKLIEKELETNEYWKGDSPDIKTFKDHIKIHKKNIHNVEQLKDITEELYVRLWDNEDVGRNIFFGNHVGCCTSVGSSNSFAAPQHLMNIFVNGIEIVDKSGNSMGNSMCYFAKVDDKLTFIIDSFEANGKLGAAPEVTNAVIEYAKKVCAEMGVPDANIMFGPNYNKIDFSRCIKTGGHKIEIIGRAPNATYIDCIGGYGDVNSIYTNRPMHEIMDL